MNGAKHDQCVKAAEAWLAANCTAVSALPSFRNVANRDATVCSSHLIRSGLEFLGDKSLYQLVGLALMRTIPDRVALYPSILTALTCNSFLGNYMAAQQIHRRTTDKTGGDTCETVVGSLVRDRPDDYGGLEDWAVEFLRPIIYACVSALVPSKRKHQDDYTSSPSQEMEQRPAKRSCQETTPSPPASTGPNPSSSTRPLSSPDTHSAHTYTTPAASPGLARLMAFMTIEQDPASPKRLVNGSETRRPFSDISNITVGSGSTATGRFGQY
ncbi:hypothetical protein C8R47DRAFT_1328004 [Mycena vitilis]|nr:hypothetical protein C8R47DRAFT_1328004 [Mycena vitilis]